MQLPAAARWALVPFVAMASCSGTVVLAGTVSDGMRPFMTIDSWRALEAIFPADVRVGLGRSPSLIAVP